ncbi:MULTISPECIES: YlbF family regulator [unclassified Lactobacillus]|uniref:YlbF family regulator n=1 Tax=unclassified Lactobacillus TaxID=2620435 RepID=UPI000EFAEC97|nr:MULTISPECIES: YlbF family regulator [unclassified Lactobacillus]RMC24229.1 YlbF family regulator [Lactobacillus sp. ESL0247]RMC28802.1 YlbF family regulator [Lactobacillus sp. ESL0246]RMC31459.1 YlbF family regulator [Lactobacillus sp. ESL0245]RMC49125.1 YlbF family regulator [Lactobacillus sp. ESL0228]
MVNIYDSANQVAADLRQIDEYKALEKAIAEVKSNEKSLKLFQEMDKMQTKIINLQSQGKDLSKELQDNYQKLNEDVQKDPQIIKLLQTEQVLYKLIDDIQKAITKPISDLYDGLRN